MDKCYCGGEVKLEGIVEQCQECCRLYVRRDDSLILLIPHNGWVKKLNHKEIIENQTAKRGEQITVEWYCLRCGGPMAFDGQTHRTTCLDDLCGYSTYEGKTEGRPALDVKLEERGKQIIKELSTIDGTTEQMAELVIEMQGIKKQREAISEERL